MRVLNDRLLVLLPPNPEEQQTTAGLFLAHALTPPTSYGRVVKIGPKVRDVQPGDMVAFSSTAGDLVSLGAHECLFLRESDVVATIQKQDVSTEVRSA